MWLTVSVKEKEKDTTENLLWCSRKATAFSRFLMLSTAVATLFSLVHWGNIHLGGKKKSNPPNQEKSSKCTIITVILTIHSCYWKAAANLYEVCMWEDRELADIPEGSFNPAREGIRWIAHQHQHNQQQLSHVILINRSTRTNYRTSI